MIYFSIFNIYHSIFFRIFRVANTSGEINISETEKYPLNYTAIYDETATFLNILVRKQRILNDAL